MKREHLFMIFAVFFTFVIFYLLYRILSPFLTAVLWAILLAMLFYPLYRKLESALNGRAVLAALAISLLVVLVIILPCSLLLISLGNEAVSAYHDLQEITETGQLQAYFDEIVRRPSINWVWSMANEYLSPTGVDPGGFLLKNLNQISTLLFNQTSTVLKGISAVIAGFFFTLLSLYYLFKDGDHLFKRFKEMIPVPSREKDLFIQRFKDMVFATIYGGILIAVIQGLLGGLAYWILGIHSPVLWGTAMAFLSFIPIGGTALVWAPTAAILFLKSHLLKGMILLLIGVFGISMVDNLVRPYFISSRTHIHPLLLFFAVLGGIETFGLIGIVVGPLIASLCITLIEIYIQSGKASPEGES
jgi:predicted PurR-regulated permease PerM